jgi:hypothetical protein
MKNYPLYPFLSFCFLVFSTCVILSCNTSEEPGGYEKTDLKKIRWIEGNWKGMAGTTPFYEIYRIENDSLMRIISYNWNGKDSIGTSVTPLHWSNGSYYLGDSLNWKVTDITDSSISMKPNYKAGNDILWKKRNSNSWDAILTGKKSENRYLMERIDHFNSAKTQ